MWKDRIPSLLKAFSLKGFLLGGVAFWIPDLVLHVARGDSFAARDIVIITILLPCSALVTFGYLVIRRSPQVRPAWISVSMILGIWMLGPWLILASTTLRGHGLHAELGGLAIIAVATVVPFYTFIMATYDGSLFALLGVTFLIPVAGAVSEVAIQKGRFMVWRFRDGA